VSLRDAIMRQVDPLHEDATAYRPEGVAIAVLAMPEMKAIRQALRSLAAHRVQVVPEEAADWFAALNLPQSVIDWVLAKDTTLR